jgi:hypothetical protein
MNEIWAERNYAMILKGESHKKLQAHINPPPTLILAGDIVANKTRICVSVQTQ